MSGLSLGASICLGHSVLQTHVSSVFFCFFFLLILDVPLVLVGTYFTTSFPSIFEKNLSLQW